MSSQSTSRSFACAVAIGLTAVTLAAQSLELKPGYISGIVSVGATINQMTVQAYWQSQSSSSSFNSGNYTVTVNVPSGSSPVYTVRPIIRTDSSYDYLELPTKTVAVAENAPSTLDFNLAPAYVNGSVTVQNGTLNVAYIYANDGTGTWYAETRTDLSRGSQFTFPVVPGSIRVWGTVYFTNGTSVSIPTQLIGTVAAEGQLTVNLSATAPNVDGAIQGTASVTGTRVPSLRRVTASGPVYRSVSPATGGSYLISSLPAGSYQTFAEIYYNQNTTYYQSPYGIAATGYPPVSVLGNTVTRDFTLKQAFIQGTFALTGTRTLAHATDAQVSANGQGNTSTQWGYARDQVTRPSGQFELIVSPGTWFMNSYNRVTFLVTAPDSYLNGSLNIYDYTAGASPILVAEEDIANVNLTYETGTVTAVLRSAGVTFSSPRTYASCNEIVNNQYRTSWYADFYGNQTNVTVAPVTMVGIKGRCTIYTYGRPAGSSGEVLFGQVTVDVVPGSDLTIDVGGPTLTVASPAANSAFTAGPITVSGTATDDQEVTSVTVNGMAATLSSTNNPNDPRQVSFAATIPLSNGANQISTIATDNSGKTASDTRNVYLDSQDPTVTWSPAGGTIYPTPGNITVSGTATDNLGISTITVNGAVVYTTPGTPQTAVNFSRVLSLNGGTHQLTVVVKDLGNRTITETRTITVIAPESTTVVTTSPNPSVSGQNVTLAATVSAAGDATGTPTGSVQFKVDGVLLGTMLLSGGSASFTTSSMAIGNRSISAVYSGSSIFLGSTGTTSHAVNKVTTSTAIASNLNPSTYGQSVTFTASVTSVAPGSGTPSGSIQFKQNGLNLGPPAGLSGGVASKVVTGLTAGTTDIEAVYSGSATYDGSTGTLTQTINKATPAVTWLAPSQIVYGTALGATQLNASANVPGTFSYNPSSGTLLNAGSHALTATFTPTDIANYSTVERTVAINVLKAPATLTLGALSQTHNGSARAATVTTDPAGLVGVSITYDGSPSAPSAVGSYAVVASLANDNYDASPVTGTMTIEKGPATISLSNLSQVYNTSPRVVSASTNPAGLQGVSITYDGSPTPPVNAGSYAVVASLDNPNYTASNATGTLVVDKATATLTLGNLLQTYDGSGKAAIVTTTPATLAGVSLTYNGAAAQPVEAGAYLVRTTLTHQNYQATPVEANLVIAKANQSITFGSLTNRVFGDPPFAVTATASSGLAVTFAASGGCSITAATVTILSGGLCTITAAQPGNGNYNAAAPVPQSFNATYSWTNVLQPINVDGSSVFKLGSTVPVKFQLTGASATLTDLVARLYVAKVSNGVTGTEAEAVSTTGADTGNVFRYDTTSAQYIFNLGTKSLSQGTWQIRIDFGDGTTNAVLVSLRK